MANIIVTFCVNTPKMGGKILGTGNMPSVMTFFTGPCCPVGLEVDDQSETGISSGGAFLSRKGVPHIVYHSIDTGICIAKAKDESLVEWIKFEQNPVIVDPPKASIHIAPWDPHILTESDAYYMLGGGNP